MLQLTPPIIFLGTLLILILSFNAYSIFQLPQFQSPLQSPMGQSTSHMSFSEFDKQKAREFMDKNNDGKCDACGMPIDQCIASGMMQCSMDPTATLGVLGSQHIHADFKLYLDDKPFDWAPFGDRHERQMHGDATIKDTSAFIHIHPAPSPEKTGDVIHMHATGVPLSLFFESLNIPFDKKSRLFVNGKENKEGKEYVFKDGDNILITDGTGNMQEQLNSVTDFARNHGKQPSQISLPQNIQSSAPLKFNSFEEEVTYYKKNAKNPNNINIEQAIRNMDSNLDGVCDKCGMAILHCIEQGMENM